MGIGLKIIGLLLFLGGLYGLFVTLPNLLLNLTVDQFNPLIILGLIEGGTEASIFDLLLSFFLIGIGIVFIRKKDGIPKVSR